MSARPVVQGRQSHYPNGTKRKGNPNWGRKGLDPSLLERETAFGAALRELGLNGATLEQATAHGQLRARVKAIYKSRYVPEELLRAYDFNDAGGEP